MSRFVILSRYSYWPGRPNISRVLRPAVIASGLPDSVPACGDIGSSIHQLMQTPVASCSLCTERR